MSPEPPRSDAASEAASPEPRALVLFGIPVHDVTEDEVVAWMVARARSGRRGHIVTSNLDFARLAAVDPEMRRIHADAELVIPDGMPLVWFSRLFGPRLRERVAGSDLVSRFAEAARDHGLSVYAVGSAPGVAERALGILKERYPGLRVAGWESPPVAPILAMEDAPVLERVRAAHPDVLFVAFGAPKQEKWIRLHHLDWGVPVSIGIGGSLDFIAGTQTRAPRWAQRIGMEWFWRMAGQPRRLFKRYLLDFLYLAGTLTRSLLLRLSPAGPTRLPPPPAPGLLAGREADLILMDAEGKFPEPSARSAVLDLSRRAWLDSEDLGRLASLARRCRERGGRLFLVGRAPRVDRLLRLQGLEGYLALPGSERDLLDSLDRMGPPGATEPARLLRSGPRLEVSIPAEFARETVSRVREEFLRHWNSGEIREVVLDASGMEFMDSAGARFLLAAQRLVEREPGRSIRLSGFSEDRLQVFRREGLGSLPTGPGGAVASRA